MLTVVVEMGAGGSVRDIKCSQDVEMLIVDPDGRVLRHGKVTADPHSVDKYLRRSDGD